MKKWLAILCLIGICHFHTPVFAEPFPEKTEEIVQDKYQYLDQEEIGEFAEFVKSFPEQYKVIVIESYQPEANSVDEYAEKLFDHYNLSDDTLLLVLNIDTEELGVYPGPVLVEKGAKMEMLHDKIASFYGPYKNQGEYLKGIKLFIDEVNNEFERIAALPLDNLADEPAAEEEQTSEEDANRSIWSLLPWWVYTIGIVFLLLIIGLIYAFIRRRSIFGDVDDVEDWKDELVEKIQMIEVEKPLRRAGGTTEERYVMLASRKENLLRMRIPEVEMIILEAEEACDRLRFKMALGLLEEGREILLSIEKELDQLKTESTVVAQAKQETRNNIPEIGKLMEAVERKLTNVRLEYGLAFHELKGRFDQVEQMRLQAKEALAGGDDLEAFEITRTAHKILQELAEALEQIPQLVVSVQQEMPRQLREWDRQFEQRDTGEAVDTAMLQARQIALAAQSALEDGNISLIETHLKAFSVKMEEVGSLLRRPEMPENIVNRTSVGQVAATADAPMADLPLAGAAHADLPAAAKPTIDPLSTSALRPAVPQTEEIARDEREARSEQEAWNEREAWDEHGAWDDHEDFKQAESREMLDALSGLYDEPSRAADRYEDEEEQTAAAAYHEASGAAMPDEQTYSSWEQSVSQAESRQPELEDETDEDEVEYELVIPRQEKESEPVQEPTGYAAAKKQPVGLNITCEDDVLDEMERISNALIRIRQKLKRSYLPGIPDEVTYQFEQVVQSLGQVKVAIERYNYRLDEVANLLQEANEELAITEQLAESVIANCQLAESAIQYANRYRRQSSQVNELLMKAEQEFRQLRFKEALLLAEEARNLVEKPVVEPAEESGWLLRRKKRS